MIGETEVPVASLLGRLLQDRCRQYGDLGP